MKAPLIAFPIHNKLYIVSNGQISLYPSPELDAIFPVSWYSKLQQSTEISMLNTPYYFIASKRYDRTESDVNTIEEALQCKMDYEKWINGPGSWLPFSYTEYMYTTHRETMRSLAHTKPLIKTCMDIEVCSDGSGIFPTPLRNPIAAIGCKTNDDVTVILSDFDPKRKGMEDHKILMDFVEYIYQNDPDIITTYNGKSFDLPYIMTRLEINAIDPAPLLGMSGYDISSETTLHSIYRHGMYIKESSNPHILGRRIHYDIYHTDVIRDQKLSGKVKDRKMKTIAHYFYPNTDDIVMLSEDNMENIWGEMTTSEGKKTIEKYLESDILQTSRLEGIYFEANNVIQAESLEVPLSAIVGRRNNTIPSLHLLRNLLDEKMMILSSNVKTYDVLVQRLNMMKQKKFYQGAYVDILKKGKIPKPIYKVDLKSLYPSIIRTFNLSYETVKAEFTYLDIEKPIDTNPETMSSHITKDNLILEYNDDVLKVRAKVTINMTKRGLIPRILDHTVTERERIRKTMGQMKPHSTEYIKADSAQNFLKVLANSVYGICGQRTGMGYLPIGMTITAIGRWVTQTICSEINKEQSTLVTMENT